MSIPKRLLGGTGMNVTVLGYSAHEIRGSRVWDGRPVSDRQADSILNCVLDAGVNFISTANCYGRSEELIGRYLHARRETFYLATKCGCRVSRRHMFSDQVSHEFSRENILRSVHESLRRLRTDCIDLVSLHHPGVGECTAEQVTEVLHDLQQQGKVRWLGVSGALPDLGVFLAWRVFDVVEVPYSPREPRHENLIALTAQAGCGVIVKARFAGGTPRHAPGPNAGQRNRAISAPPERSASVPAGIRFVLGHPEVDTLVVGTLNPEHLREDIATATGARRPADSRDERVG